MCVCVCVCVCVYVCVCIFECVCVCVHVCVSVWLYLHMYACVRIKLRVKNIRIDNLFVGRNCFVRTQKITLNIYQLLIKMFYFGNINIIIIKQA